MVEPFSSVYRKDYRNTPKDDEPEPAIPCAVAISEENFLPEKDSKVLYNPERDDEVIRGLMKKRMQSIYQTSYRHPGTGKKSDKFSDEFMNYFHRVFEKKTQALLRPPETSRTIYGYSRFDLYYTGFSTYQDEISFEAYKVFKKDFDNGISRLFRKKNEMTEQEDS